MLSPQCSSPRRKRSLSCATLLTARVSRLLAGPDHEIAEMPSLLDEEAILVEPYLQ